MMNNLFSIFDPSTNLLNMAINWISTSLWMMFIPYSFIPNRQLMLWN